MILSQNFISYYKKYMFWMGFLGNLMFVLQTYRIFETKSSADVSLEGFLVAFVSITSWLFYGYLVNDKVLFRVNLIGVITSSTCLGAIIYYRL